MGTPVPDPPIDHGNDCDSCCPPAPSMWLPGETPEFVYVYFASIESCPLAIQSPPNGRTFKLTQTVENPCKWEYWGPKWHVFWLAMDPLFLESMLYLEEVGGLGIFVSRTINCPPECFVYHSTIEVCAWPTAGRFGIGVVHWMGIALGIIVSLSLPMASTIMHELFVTDDDKVVHKFCFPKYGMNVKFLME